MQKVSRTPDEYIASLSDELKNDVEVLDKKISEVMGTSRVLWEGVFWGGSQQTIIGYGDFSYKRSDKETVEWFMVGLAVQKNYISIYINAVEDNQYVAKKYAHKLGKVKVGSSSISFKQLSDVNIEELIRLVNIAKKQLK